MSRTRTTRVGRTRRAYRPRHELEWLTELWVMEPASAIVQAIYSAARHTLPRQAKDEIVSRQAFLQRVSERFHRRLQANAIFVEGANP